MPNLQYRFSGQNIHAKRNGENVTKGDAKTLKTSFSKRMPDSVISPNMPSNQPQLSLTSSKGKSVSGVNSNANIVKLNHIDNKGMSGVNNSPKMNFKSSIRPVPIYSKDKSNVFFNNINKTAVNGGFVNVVKNNTTQNTTLDNRINKAENVILNLNSALQQQKNALPEFKTKLNFVKGNIHNSILMLNSAVHAANSILNLHSRPTINSSINNSHPTSFNTKPSIVPTETVSHPTRIPEFTVQTKKTFEPFRH